MRTNLKPNKQRGQRKSPDHHETVNAKACTPL